MTTRPSGSSRDRPPDSSDGPAAPAARSLGWGFGVLAASAYALIVLGALVRANHAGLACPDWPLCFGAWVPVFDFRIALEWGHRVFAAAVSLGVVAGTLGLWRAGLLRDAAGAVALVWALLALQIVLGGLTVLLGLAPWTVTAHLLVGTAVCAALLWLSRALFERVRPRARAPQSRPLRAAVAVTAALVGLQIALGGLVSSHYAGLACASFPTCDGTAIAPTLSGLVGLHVLHRLNALAVTLAFGGVVWLARRQGAPAAWARLGFRLLLLQWGVGIANVLLRLPVEVTALHSALAAVIALVTLLLVREVWLAPAAHAERVSATPSADAARVAL